MRGLLIAMCILLTMCVCSGGWGETWYVDGSASEFGDGSSPETPLEMIQEGIDAASAGDTVIVAQGTYTENVRFNGKSIILQSNDPGDPAVVGNTVIDGHHAGSTVTFDGTEDRGCVLSGFTIRNGSATYGGGICGGTFVHHTRAVIRNNTISDNSAVFGGGLIFCEGTIHDNIISNNEASFGGGGIAYCHGTIHGNEISWNTTTKSGGAGLYASNGTVQNNVIVQNMGRGPWGNQGGGLQFCHGLIRNNVIARNFATYRGGGLAFCWGTITNCIIWGNTAGASDFQVCLSHDPSCSCIQDWTGPGGNISSDPRLTADYHLQADSPCIDAGCNQDWMWQGVDCNGNPRILRGKSSRTVDMGAFEYVPAPAGTTLYVDGTVPESGDGSSWETAFQEVQEGIDAASDGDTVLVAAGTYTENVSFKGKNIVVRSSDKSGGLAVSDTILDGGQAGPVVTFAGTENESCVLSAFTIRNGNGTYGGGICGGTASAHTQARIENNVITGNSADYGGAAALCKGPILNNTICGNSAANEGGALFGCQGIIRNCIVQGNAGGDQLYASTTPAYSSIENWTGGGEGNIARHPYFVDAPNANYRLQSWSLCIDRGDPHAGFQAEPGANGGRVNIGAYGNTPEATPPSVDGDEDRLPDGWEIELFGDLAQGSSDDPDGDLLSNLYEYYRGSDPATAGPGPVDWYVDRSVAASGDGTSWETAFGTIQEGINAASHGDTVIVAEGSYIETIELNGKNITVRSTDPLDPDVVSSTTIHADRAGSVVTFTGAEDETCLFSGFTIQNGSARYGGGICGGTVADHTHATIRDNVITLNSATAWGGGAGVSFCDGAIQNNTISENSLDACGGGLFCCRGTMQNNKITANWSWLGGGLCSCEGAIENNQITQNTSSGFGGALLDCMGTIENNVIRSNTASDTTGGPIWCHGVIRNNLICDNTGPGAGGGLSVSYGLIENNTICNNRVAGLWLCDGTIRNNILWGNGVQINQAVVPTYSCIQDWTGGGEGNISEGPQFVDSPGGDYHLSESSPCLDVGANQDWMWDAVDLDGKPRILRGDSSQTVDMGAYEYFDVTADTSAPYADKLDPAPDATDVYINGNIVLHLKDDGMGVDKASIVMTVNGSPVTPTITGTPLDFTVTYDPPTDFEKSQTVTVTVDARDRSSPAKVMVQVTYSFTTSAEEPPDLTPPEITLSGEEYMTWELGIPYVDPGCTAWDDKDGDVTGNVQVSPTVDHTVAGTYILHYSVSDAAGNPAEEKTRTVKVVKPFKVTQFAGHPPAPVALMWESEVGATYTVWSCSDMGSGKWNEEATVPSQGESSSWLDFNTSFTCKFYRIEIE